MIGSNEPCIEFVANVNRHKSWIRHKLAQGEQMPAHCHECGGFVGHNRLFGCWCQEGIWDGALDSGNDKAIAFQRAQEQCNRIKE